VRRGPSEVSLAQAFVAQACRDAAVRLRRRSDVELGELFDELWELPAVHLTLQVELPKVFSPELDRLADAVRDDDLDPEVLEAVVEKIDTPFERVRLARAVMALAEAGAIGRLLAAAALVDLGSGSRRFVRAGLLEAVAVRVGVARTPGGIVLAA
jgi:hypothetical protein